MQQSFKSFNECAGKINFQMEKITIHLDPGVPVKPKFPLSG